ncbi:MAG: hypothetical protein KAY82_01130 [Hylemonella sp.]|nr:hypothetical protein [Hylemonella sp.]
MKPFSRIPKFANAVTVLTALLLSLGASAAGPWQLLGSSDKGMALIESYPSEAECKKAMALAVQRQGQRDFMCTVAGAASNPAKK